MTSKKSVLFLINTTFLPLAICLFQSRLEGQTFAISFNSGLTFGIPSWTFYTENNSTPLKPGVSLTAGVQYGPLVTLHGASIYSSVEVAYGRTGTGKQRIKGSIIRFAEENAAELEIRSIPIMVWLTLITDNILSPYIRFGAGLSRTDVRDEYFFSDGPTARFHQWDFTWGIGGGLNLKILDNLELALFLDDWITPSDLQSAREGWATFKLKGPNKMTAVGFRCLAHL